MGYRLTVVKPQTFNTANDIDHAAHACGGVAPTGVRLERRAGGRGNRGNRGNRGRGMCRGKGRSRSRGRGRGRGRGSRQSEK
jgi:hypothetical protein